MIDPKTMRIRRISPLGLQKRGASIIPAAPACPFTVNIRPTNWYNGHQYRATSEFGSRVPARSLHRPALMEAIESDRLIARERKWRRRVPCGGPSVGPVLVGAPSAKKWEKSSLAFEASLASVRANFLDKNW